MTKPKRDREARTSDTGTPNSSQQASAHACSRLHLLIGWWSLLAFLTLGIALEYLHAFRVPWYIDLGEPEVRRFMWTLAHAHGTLISLIHLAFAFSVFLVNDWGARMRNAASCFLSAAGLLMPVGFFLGGVFVYDGDPGMGVYLVLPGALLLFVSVLLTGIAVITLDVRPETVRAE